MTESKDVTLTLSLAQLNGLAVEEARAFFLQCCQCSGWADNMVASRPFQSVAAVVDSATELWTSASHAMILEAFQGHALIGDRDAIKRKFSAAAKEQGKIDAASDATITALATENKAYFDTYGFIFIVCATGKSAEQMLVLLRQRMGNSREQELHTGACEQGKITRLRLQQRLSDMGA